MKHKLPEELAKWYDEAYCLVAVKQDGRTLQYVNWEVLTEEEFEYIKLRYLS